MSVMPQSDQNPLGEFYFCGQKQDGKVASITCTAHKLIAAVIRAVIQNVFYQTLLLPSVIVLTLQTHQILSYLLHVLFHHSLHRILQLYFVN